MTSENPPSLFEYGARLLARDTGEFSDYSVSSTGKKLTYNKENERYAVPRFYLYPIFFDEV